MKKIYSILILLTLIFSSHISWSQVVSTVPAFPTKNSKITITFDSSLESKLGTFSGDLYAHTGVIIEGNTEWQHVIGTWGNNSAQPKLTNNSDGTYTLVITPNITDYYSVTSKEVVRQIALVFRSADGNQQTNDLLIDIYKEGLHVSFSAPANNKMIAKNEALEIIVKSNISESLSLYLDNNLVENTTTKQEITTTVQTDILGDHELIAVATYGAEEARDTIHFYTKNNVVEENMPDGITEGINYIDDNTVTLSLYAPNKKYVYLIGDFNNWLLNNSYQMKKDGDYFWLTLDKLTPAKEYVFQYYIDGNIKIADPYADKLLDPWNDKYITKEVYPNLIAYPSDKTSEFASVLQTAQTDFTWDDTGFVMPDHDDLVIYELLIRDFTKAGDIKTVTDTLDYLQRLGINAIELMPFNEFEGNDSWGYNPAFYFAPDKAYGTKNDYKTFINECHKRGIAVIMDMVLNHSFKQSPFYRMYEEGGKPSSENPWYNRESNFQNTQAHWGADFNHESLETQKLVDRINSYWINTYHIDGYRFDFTKGFSNTPYGPSSWGNAYDANRIRLLKRMATKIWDTNPKAFISFEHLSDNPEERELAAHGIHLWGNANHNYYKATVGDYSDSDLSWTSWKNRTWVAPKLISYMESHDEERLMVRNLNEGKSFGDYNVRDFSTALSRIETAASIFFTTPGPKIIWQFGELAYDISINENGRTGKKPIKWNYLDNPDRLHLYQVFSALIKLKIQEPAFSSDNFTLNTSGALKRVEINHADMDVRVIANFDLKAGSITPNFSKTGTWYNYFNGTELTVTDVNMNINLKAGEYRLFTTKQLETPSIQEAPVANKLTISGDFIVDKTLTALYVYSDINGDTEGESTIAWYRANNTSGANEIEIQTGRSLKYTITKNDAGKHLRFAVTPVATSGNLLNGIKVYSNYSTTIDYATGIEDVLDKELSIYPNPVDNLIHLDNLKQVKRISLYSLTGKSILYKNNPNSNEIINLSHLSQGIYLIVFHLKDGSKLTRKVVKL